MEMFVMERFKDRRSIRKYKRQEVPEEMIAALAEEASRAATMGNMQLYSLVVTTDADVQEREALAEAHHHQPMVEEAPAVLTFCADFHRFSRWCEERKAEPGYGNFVSFINAATDTLLFAQAFITLAEERGLGTCILGTTVYNPDRIIEALHLPHLVVPVLTVTLGWPDEAPEQTAVIIMTIPLRISTVYTLQRKLCRRAAILWNSTVRTTWPRYLPVSASQRPSAWRCPPRCRKCSSGKDSADAEAR